MKSLNTIQTISKVIKIISKIIFILSIVGACLCAVGIIFTAAGTPVFKIGGVTVKSIIENAENLTTGTVVSELTAGLLISISTIIISKRFVSYFNRELKDGTPFTLDGAKEMQKLGIISICVSLGAQIAANIAHEIIAKIFSQTAELNFSFPSYVAVGVTLIIVAQICKYGAELQEKNNGASTEEKIS